VNDLLEVGGAPIGRWRQGPHDVDGDGVERRRDARGDEQRADAEAGVGTRAEEELRVRRAGRPDDEQRGERAGAEAIRQTRTGVKSVT
jgi:hypothetical protein